MGLTYTSAADRDAWRAVGVARTIDSRHVSLALTSLVAVLAIALAYGGRVRANASPASAPRAASLINLNAVSNSLELEPLFQDVFTSSDDRRFAARHLFQFIVPVRDSGDGLRNVGTILLASVPVSAIERTPGLVDYRERLRVARDRAAKSGSPLPTALPLIGSDDLTVLKSSAIVRTPAAFRRLTLRWAAVYLGLFWALAVFWWLRSNRGDYVLLAAAHLLTGVGFAVLLSRADPLRDTTLFVRYVEGVGVGIAVFGLLSALDFRKAAFLTLSYVPLLAALLLSGILLLFGGGPAGSNAKVNLGPVQPIEAIRLLLALFLAGYFARRWELLRQVRGHRIRQVRIPGWINVPRVDYVLPVLVGIGAALLFFFLQKDLGPALLLSCVFLAVYAIARKGVVMAGAGLAILVAGFYVGHALNISATLAARVEMWRSAWDNGVRGGDQIAQAIWALSSGSVFGHGLGLGDTRYLPAGHTDLVLAAIGEELGFLGVLSVAGVFVVIASRGFRTALRTGYDYGFFLAMTVTLFLVLPVLVMAAGILGLIPLTGVVTPFLSYGGSAMAANFAALGMLAGIRNSSESAPPAEPFRTGVRDLSYALGLTTVALLAILAMVQVVRGDEYLVRPHLGVQADGARRYQYNPRVLDAVALLPRGTVYDRTGLPLATSDARLADTVRGAYRKRGVELEAGCAPSNGERCYPLDGATFHLLGDVRTRRNWAATNTSYVERDAQGRLRGFDDRAASVPLADSSGRAVLSARRDYADLIPLIRHRHEPDHPKVRAFLDRPRDVHLTIDAPLQARVSGIVAKYAQRSATGRAAAVVIDPDTGNLLASASYPVPAVNGSGGNRRIADDSDSLLDRARYGLYPPGSTFKLVTAAAALRQDHTSKEVTFTCTRLQDGRVGARIPGWGVIRDDVLITRPHGIVGMHDAIARSCNGYFAQLALRTGPRAILDISERLGISVARPGTLSRLRATLPQAAYGQGDVVATPLRMARVSAMIASGGVLRELRSEAGQGDRPPGEAALSRDSAALLGRSLRDAVRSGTARSLSGHRWPIAGKTGTAEVTGARSHAWFVGFAPYGKAERRIAFAIVIENAGYGGLAAAPAAGEIVTAAAASGLVR